MGSSIIGCSELANQQPIIPQVTWGRGLAKTQLWILLPVSALFICITWGPVRGGTERVVGWMNDTKNKSPQSYVRVWCYKNIVNKGDLSIISCIFALVILHIFHIKL